MSLNERALRLVQGLVQKPDDYRIKVATTPAGSTLLDLGVECAGGLQAGLALARVCLADRADVALSQASDGQPRVIVHTDHPLAACMASQYAGWQLATDDFFGMGSGPMRLTACSEPLFAELGLTQEPSTSAVVGVIETGQLPTAAVYQLIGDKCRVNPEAIHLLVAPTASLAGGLQVVARSVETALHKLHEIGFDLQRVVSAIGSAPLPPVAKNDLAAIGRTNDAILYGGQVTLYVTGDDDSIRELGPQVPSSASADSGRPFLEIFEKYERDFYKIDKLLFSPARITFANLETGRQQVYGELQPEILNESFQS